MDESSIFRLPSQDESGQGYNTVGWLLHAHILLLSGAGYRNDVVRQQQQETLGSAGQGTHAQNQFDHTLQAAPPETLAAAGKVRTPAMRTATAKDARQDLGDAGTKAAKISEWP